MVKALRILLVTCLFALVPSVAKGQNSYWLNGWLDAISVDTVTSGWLYDDGGPEGNCSDGGYGGIAIYQTSADTVVLSGNYSFSNPWSYLRVRSQYFDSTFQGTGTIDLIFIDQYVEIMWLGTGYDGVANPGFAIHFELHPSLCQNPLSRLQLYSSHATDASIIWSCRNYSMGPYLVNVNGTFDTVVYYTTITLTNLSRISPYTVTVVDAADMGDAGCVRSMTFTTDTCDEKVHALRVLDNGDSWIRLGWNTEESVGPYRVVGPGIDTLVTNSNLLITGLSPNSEYTYSVVSMIDSCCDDCKRWITARTRCYQARVNGLEPLIGNSSITLTADAADAYLWSTGETTQSITIDQAGYYWLKVFTNANGGCSDSLYFGVSNVSLDMDIDIPSDICAGESVDVRVGMGEGAQVRINNNILASMSDPTRIFLPDGIDCNPDSDHGCSYRSGLVFNGFGNHQLITDPNDIRYVMLDIEHSYIGDLYINITCPNGQNADILRFAGNGVSDCTSQIDSTHRGWQDGSSCPGCWLGAAWDNDDRTTPCDSTQEGNHAGTGWRYCWSNNYDNGYTYADGDALIYRMQNSISAHGGYTDGSAMDSSNVAAGTHFYHPDQSFESLLGCPMNGEWYIEVIDGWGNDNGYIFGWELALNPERLQRNNYTPSLSQAQLAGVYNTQLTDTTFRITAPDNLAHDTVVTYTITITDNDGNTFDSTFTMAFHPQRVRNMVCHVVESALPVTYYGQSFASEVANYPITVPMPDGCDSTIYLTLTVATNVTLTKDTTVCANQLPLTWMGHTFAAAGTYTETVTLGSGADSTITLNVTVLPWQAAVINGARMIASGETITLTADAADAYLWSTGDTTQSIQVTAPGQYKLITNPGTLCADTAEVMINYIHLIIDLPTDICANDSLSVIIGNGEACNVRFVDDQATLSINERYMLPNGSSCGDIEGHECGYYSEMSFSGFGNGATVRTANDIKYLMLNIEHSFISDLWINLKCPNGQNADILRYGYTNDPNCIAPEHRGWTTISGLTTYNYGDFGRSVSSYASSPCDSTLSANAPGTGWRYCWSDNDSEGYTYAQGRVYHDVNIPGGIVDSSNLVLGTQFYHPDENFGSLIGCPLNGIWSLEVVDGYPLDNGWIFGWGLALAGDQLAQTTPVASTSLTGDWSRRTSDSSFVIEPPAGLTHDTTVVYTLTFVDSTGVTYDTTFAVSFHPYHPAVINGARNLYGSDTVTLTANGAQYCLWSTGDTAQTIAVTTSGTYTLVVNPGLECADTAEVAINKFNLQIDIPSQICYSDSIEVIVGKGEDCNVEILSELTTDFIQSVNERFMLPDANNNGPIPGHECGYYSEITFNGFQEGATVTSADDIRYVMINFEHSQVGNLYMELRCPNGQGADILKYIGSDGTGPCFSALGTEHRGWDNSYGSNSAADFGIALNNNAYSQDYDTSLAILRPGTGWRYCWSDNTTEGYTYASGKVYHNINVHTNRIDSSNVAAGTHFYHPDECFAALIGCPLNGTWSLEVTDHFSHSSSGNNGWIFGWDLALTGAQYDSTSFASTSLTGDWSRRISDTSFVIAPPANLPYDTTITYSLTLTDSAGMSLDTTFSVTFVHTAQLTVTPDTVIVAGSSVTLEAQSEASYIWNDAAGNMLAQDTNITVSPLTPTWYYATTDLYDRYSQQGGGFVCDFEDGNTGFSSNYYYSSNSISSSGYYGIISDAHQDYFAFEGHDHTTGSGYFMVCNGSTNSNQIVWEKTVPVTPNTDYEFSMHHLNVCSNCNTVNEQAVFQIVINGINVGSTFSTLTNRQWQRNSVVWNSGDNTTATIRIKDLNVLSVGNDFGLDDISLTPIIPANVSLCGTTDSVLVNPVWYETKDTSVCSNTLPLVWNGHTYNTATTFVDTLTSSLGADSIVTYNVAVIPSQVAVINGAHPLYGQHDTVVLTADSADAYLWSTGDTTRSISVATPGCYTLTVNAGTPCSDMTSVMLTRYDVDFSLDITNQICAKDSIEVLMGWGNDRNVRLNVMVDNGTTTIGTHSRNMIPSNANCGDALQHGCSYYSTATASGFAPTATVTNANDIEYLMMKLEHSYVGDLYMKLTCPNGQSADIMRSRISRSSACGESISGTHVGWDGSSTSASADFGLSISYSGNCDTNSSDNIPGTGWRYCWSNNTSVGYTYANGNVYCDNNITSGIIDSTNMAAKTQFYHPDESFDALIGCPMNGDWSVEVLDMGVGDNGWVFEWQLAFNNQDNTINYHPNGYALTGDWASSINDSAFVINPPANLAQDTTVIYNVYVTDSLGNTYDTSFAIAFTHVPNLSVTPDTVIAAGTSVMLQAVGSSVYVWSNAAGTVLGNSNNLIVSPLAPTWYYVSTGAEGPATEVMRCDFEQGNTGFTSGYRYSTSFSEGDYILDTDAGNIGNLFAGHDHTSGSGTFMICNGAADHSIPVWEKTVAVTPNTDYELSMWHINICSACHWSSQQTIFQVKINDNNVGNTFSTNSDHQWHQKTLAWNSGNSTSATIRIMDMNGSADGDDFGIDDIVLSALGGLDDYCSATDSVLVTPVWEVTSDTTICSNQLPLVWDGYTYTASITHVDTLASTLGADSIVTHNVTVLPWQAAVINGARLLVGQNDTLTLVADSADRYLWNTGDTTQSIVVTEPGYYWLVVNEGNPCSDSATVFVNKMEPPIDVNVPLAMCAGDEMNVVVGMGADANVTVGSMESTLSDSQKIFLPDGTNCDPTSDHGCSYRSELTFGGFNETQTIRDVNDIQYVMLNIEHSFIGDLYINITCPNGQSADILKFNGSGTSECTSNIGSEHSGWEGSSWVQGADFGLALIGNSYDYPCDSTAADNEAGTGWRYCWSDNTASGYTYAVGHLYQSQNVTSGVVDSSDVAAGTQFYHTDESFGSLVGCPMNGTWYIEVIDGWGGDNGYIFGWELALNPNLLSLTEYNPNITHADLVGDYVTRTSDTTFTINPPVTITNDTVLTYHVTMVDSMGFSFDTSFNVAVVAIPQLTHTPDTTVRPGSTVVLTANGGDYYAWYDDDGNLISTSQSITVTPTQTTQYHVTAFASGPNTIVNGDFEMGNVGFYSDYVYDTWLWDMGKYCVGNNANTYHTNFSGTDHTSGSGNFYVANGADMYGTVVWQQVVPVVPHTDYAFGAWITNVCNTCSSDAVQTIMQFSINGQQLGSPFRTVFGHEWSHFYELWNSDTNTTATITILNQNTNDDGNDFGLDDIFFSNLVSCSISDSLTVTLKCDTIVDSTICGSALPFVWDGYTYTETTTHTDTLVGAYGFDSIVTHNVTVLPWQAAVINGARLLVGQNDTLTLVADSADRYLWNTGDTTQSIVVTEPGYYWLVVNEGNPCSDSATVFVNKMEPPIDVNVPLAMCAGDEMNVVVGMGADANVTVGSMESTLSDSQKIFLPDGTNCDPTSDHGCSYRSELTFGGFNETQTIRDVNDIQYVMLNIEHSFIGDLYINITCPNGQSADILKFNGSGTSECTSNIGSEHSGWEGSSWVQGADFGLALIGNSYDYPCDSTAADNEAGTGWRYCWSDNTASGYTYAVGHLYQSQNVTSGVVDSSDVAAGTQFYHTDESFGSLVGCPMNGTWYIEVIDGWGGDNGYIFGWELALNPNLLSLTEYNPNITHADLVGDYVTRTSDTTFTINPPVTITNDTVLTYHVTMVDSMGFSFDTSFNVAVVAIPQLTHTPDTTVRPGSTVVLTANGGDYYAWYDDDGNLISTSQSITVTPTQTTQYHVTAFASGPNTIVNGDFEMGNVGFYSDYVYDTWLWDMGKYCVGNNANTYHTNFSGTDHTSGSGNFYVANGADMYGTVVWQQVVPVVPHTDYAFGAWITNVCNTCSSDAVQTIMQFSINGQQLGSPFRTVFGHEWSHFYELWNSDTNTTATITILNQNTNDDGNDFGLDDIFFSNLVSCSISDSLTVTLKCDTIVDSTICGSALPFVWDGYTYTESTTRTDTIPSTMGYDSIITYNLTVLPWQGAVINGARMLVGNSDTVTLVADSADSYLWSDGSTTQSITVSESGVYWLVVNGGTECSDSVSVRIYQMHPPLAVNVIDTLCAGDMENIVVGAGENANVRVGGFESTLSDGKRIFLPDGIDCDPTSDHGCSYRSELVFDGFGNDEVIRDVNDIQYVMLNIEHSYIADLYINITCPNGQSADIMRFSGSGSSSCTGSIASDHYGWNTTYTWSGSSDFGMAQGGSNSAYPCDSTASGNGAGTGWRYCWSDNTSEGYSYASGYVYSVVNSHNSRVDSSNVAAGTQFYHPDESFDSLVGCPMNGTWYIEVIDGWNIDNGYIFGWSLALNPDLLSANTYIPNIENANLVGDFSQRTGDSTFVLGAPVDLASDTTVTYLVTMTDTMGVTFDTTFTVTYIALPTGNVYDTIVENSLPWNRYGQVFNNDTTNVEIRVPQSVGCDSVVTYNLHVIRNTYSWLYDTICQNQLPYTWLGWTFGATGSHQVVMPNAMGADSVVELNLFVKQNSYYTYYDTCVENALPRTFLGMTAYGDVSGWRDTIPNQAGCDSIVTWNLKVWYNDTATQNQTICDNSLATFAWNGLVSQLSPINEGEEKPAQYDTLTYATTTTHGADSTAILYLTVLPTYQFDFYDTICDGTEYHFESHDVQTAGDYYEQLQTSGLCDSVRVMHLFAWPSYQFADADTIWIGESRVYQGDTLQTEGVYDYHYLSQHGCDSSYQMSLVVLPLNRIIVIDTICEDMMYAFKDTMLAETGVYYDTMYAENYRDGDTVLELRLTVLPHPEVSISVADSSCSPLQYMLVGSASAPYLSWRSDPGDEMLHGYETEDTVYVNPTDVTYYYLTAAYRTDGFCSSTDSIRLLPLEPLTANIHITPEYLTLEDRNMVVTNHSIGHVERYTWTLLYDGMTQWANEDNESLELTVPNYVDSVCVVLEVKSRSCEDSDTACVGIRKAGLFVPNIFTPDLQTNNMFRVVGLGVTEFEIWLYDRRGDLVYHSTDINEGWDGTKAGRKCPTESYVWKVKYSSTLLPNGYNTETGTVTLVR